MRTDTASGEKSLRITPHTLDTVEFSVGDETRVGLLHLPDGGGWYPAVVVIGTAAGNLSESLTEFLVDLGYAVLTFDEAARHWRRLGWRLRIVC